MKNLNRRIPSRPLSIATLCITLLMQGSGQVFAGTYLNSCYDIPGVAAPTFQSQKALYVFIDQTMALTAPMKKSIINLVSEWGHQGEQVKISRFSANINGNFTELVFDETGNIMPSESYLFHLRRKHKKQILACIDKRKSEFHDALKSALSNTLKSTDDKLPQTNLIHSLNDFAEQLIADQRIKQKTVLLVSDGLEHSDLFSFHKQGVIRSINVKRSISIVRKKQLIPNWHNANIYFLGIGHISDEKFYARPKIIAPLKTFWKYYFDEGNGKLNANSLGTPMLLISSIL